MNILITGGAGYAGSMLTPTLLKHGHTVTVVDWCLYGDTLDEHPRLTKVSGKVGDVTRKVLDGHDAIIHLACISNDPSFELNPALGAADFDATQHLVALAADAGIHRFIYASSSSVYGAKPDDVEVTEDLPLQPLTGYSEIKAKCERLVLHANGPMVTTALRPATLCGYAPRLRLDLVVNALTSQAYFTKIIPVHGGAQYRANLHVRDMVRAYLLMLEAPAEAIAGQVFNVGTENATVLDLAQRVQSIAGGAIQIDTTAVDQRSYQLNTAKIATLLGFTPSLTIDTAIAELVKAFADGLVPDALTAARYYNVKQIKACRIS
jgi:nucleoside-diphosphate-sugar epimerase